MSYKITLEAARVNAHMTQKEAAERLNTTVKTIQNWEAGTTMPKVTQFAQLCECYQVPMDFIFLPTALA